MNLAPLSPMSALFAHVEPLLAGRRILVIGNASSAAPAQLLERGARLVQVLDPDPRRVSAAAAQNSERKLTYSQLTPHALRDGSFELALVEDVELGENLDNLVAGVKRALAATGTAIFCARNSYASSGLLGSRRGTISYDQFGEALWDQFDNVSLWGQSPFLGYSIVQFGLEQPPEPVLDNEYVSGEGETPDYYIAICDNVPERAALAEMSIVQLPASRLLSDSESGHREKERRAARRVEALEQEVARLRVQVSSSEVDRLVKELEERDTWIRQLESRSNAANGRADEAEAEIEELEKELEKTHARLVEQSKTARSQTTNDLEAEQKLATLSQTVARLEAELRDAQQQKEEVIHLSAGRKGLEEEITKLAQHNEELQQKLSQQSQTTDKLQKRIAALDAEVDDLHKQLNETDEFLRDAEGELKDAQAALTQAVAKYEAAQRELHEAQAKLEQASNEDEVTNLEEQLRERGRRLMELEGQLRKLDNFARTLKAEVTEPWGSDDGLLAEFEQLARVLAEREADLVEAEWTIGQLKRASKN